MMTYNDLISVIPKMETDRLRELIAYMKLELRQRDEETKTDGK